MNSMRKWDFDPFAEKYDLAVARSSTVHARYSEVLDAVAGVAVRSADAVVLDIGTGTGNLVARCVAAGARVVGLDPSDGMLAQARLKFSGNPRVEFSCVEDPFLQIHYPAATFDAVISTYAFHHVRPEQQPMAIKEMFRVLKPGGLWALGDLIFLDREAEVFALSQYPWLEEECFAHIDKLRQVIHELGATIECQQFTPVTWVVFACKPLMATSPGPVV
jgi:putative AdoMet-dependent methyltransferase